MKQQEELEAAVFKKFFHKKIKAMSCLKKFKYILLVLFFGGLVQGYFLLEMFMINDIDASKSLSLSYYQVIANRNIFFGQLIAYYRESLARNTTLQMAPGDLEGTDNTITVSTIDYFMDKTLANEKQYNQLRKNLPKLMHNAYSFIDDIEGEGLCLLQSVSNRTQCQTALDGILKTGMTQTINTMVKEIIQNSINFE